ncbi:MAG: hypothetical protein R3B45_04990 [Bdellovibrionota bacterium]
MKYNLLAAVFLFFAGISNSYANNSTNDCWLYPELSGASINMLGEDESDFDKVNFTLDLSMKEIKGYWLKFHDDWPADRSSCYAKIKKAGLRSKESGQIFEAFYTMDDECDGGNSFGIIVDSAGELIGSIDDSDIFCSK